MWNICFKKAEQIYCNVLVGSISQWNFIALKVQYTTVDYKSSNNGCVLSILIPQLNCSLQSKSLPYIPHAISIVTSPFELLRYYGNATNSLLCKSNCYVTMEMLQTHCYATGAATLLWKCNRAYRSRHQGNPTCNSMYVCAYVCMYVRMYVCAYVRV
jgi:hypothetical protein